MKHLTEKIETLSAGSGDERDVPIIGRRADGSTVWYTGRAGQAFVSEWAKDAFLGYSLEGARAKAMRLNVMTPIHGVRFVAVTGALANTTRWCVLQGNR